MSDEEHEPQAHPTHDELVAALEDALTPRRSPRAVVPLIFTVPAAEIDNFAPGHPMYEEAMERATADGVGAGVLFLPEEMEFPSVADSPCVTCGQTTNQCNIFFCYAEGA